MYSSSPSFNQTDVRAFTNRQLEHFVFHLSMSETGLHGWLRSTRGREMGNIAGQIAEGSQSIVTPKFWDEHKTFLSRMIEMRRA
jgi:hypothetical protein